jgi:hypothetical protein
MTHHHPDSHSDHDHDHDHHHHHGNTHHHCQHEASHEQISALSSKDRLILRLEYLLRHNQEHVNTYGNLVKEAEALGEDEAAQMILAASGYIGRQNEHLVKTLLILRSR